ncbi:MAG: SCO family protein [Pseudomonadota bacterium]
MNFRVVQIGLWVIVALAGAYVFFLREDAPDVPTAQSFQVGDPYVALTGSDGSPINTADFASEHQLLYFGFTYCPDVCPIGVRKMVTAQALYQLSGAQAPLKVVFTSFDTARDTVDILAQYETNIEESVASDFTEEEQAKLQLKLTTLTGTESEMDKALSQYPVFVNQITDPDQPDGYTYTHTDIIYWIQPGGTVKILSARHSAQDIADMLAAAA